MFISAMLNTLFKNSQSFQSDILPYKKYSIQSKKIEWGQKCFKQADGLGLVATKNNVYRRISLKRLWSRLKIWTEKIDTLIGSEGPFTSSWLLIAFLRRFGCTI